MPRLTHTRNELRNVKALSLETVPPTVLGPDDEQVETEDLASHFLMEATQSSHPPAPRMEQEERSLFDGDASLESFMGESFFDAGKADVRGFERMWHEILQRELAEPCAQDERISVIPG